MFRHTSKLLCALVWGATLWGSVVVLFASSRLNINLQFTKDVDTQCQLAERRAQPVAREAANIKLPYDVGRYANQIFGEHRGPPLGSMCTMIMLTYKRERVLTFLLNHYCKVKSLHKIIVIWNEVNKSIPTEILEIKDNCITDLHFIQAKENKLTNRFRPHPEIETDCVCIIDDDRFIVDLRDLEFGFSVWQNFRHRIVGFEHRTHIQLGNGSLWYDLMDFSKPRTNYSMILTSTAIMHKTYLEMFFDHTILPHGMIDYIEKRKNCEDIAINIMVAKFLKDTHHGYASALAVKPKREVRNMDHSKNPDEYYGLSSLPDHYAERSECLNDFKKMYGGVLPLPHTTYIFENMAVIPRRNRTFVLRRGNTTTRFLRAHNSTYLRRNQQYRSWISGNVNHSNIHRLHGNMTNTIHKSLHQQRSHSALHSQQPLKPGSNTTHYVRSNGTSFKVGSKALRPSNSSRLQKTHHNTYQKESKKE